MEPTPPKSLSEIAASTRYPVDAFHFLRLGLDYTVRKLHAEPESLSEEERHVSGEQLAEGLRDFAIEQYGLLARTILRRWRIQSTDDFGRIVFAMVEGGLMQARESDSVDDFVGVYRFDDAFSVPIPLDQLRHQPFQSGLIDKD